ncbi:MAG: HlyD family secretion protein, partial [Acetobacteraceae bacterium]|nr:HlyD family secretion protein [Acetobacteraceae bacterium]
QPAGPRNRDRLRRRLRLGVAVLALLAALGAGGGYLHRLFTHIYVDDARVAADMIAISSRVPGWVREVNVIAGDRAGAGTVVIRIDSRESELTLAEIEARLASLEARRAELEARVVQVDATTSSQQEAQRARLDSALAALPAAESDRTFAESEFRRAQELMATGSGTRQRHDQTRAALDSARQKVLGATAEIRNAEAQLAAAGAAREELNVLRRQLETLGPMQRELAAQRDRASLDLRDRIIVMPFDGVVSRIFVDPGEYVAPGQRILLLHDPARVRVEANVKETQIRHFRQGTRVKLRVDAWPGREFEGVVERVGGATTSEFALLPTPNPSGNFTKITQRLPIRITFDPPPPDHIMRPGMMVVVEVETRE